MTCKDCGVKKGQYPRWLCRTCDRKAGTYEPLSRLDTRFCRKCGQRLIQRYGLCAACWSEIRAEEAAPVEAALIGVDLAVRADFTIREIIVLKREALRTITVERRLYDVMWDGSRS